MSSLENRAWVFWLAAVGLSSGAALHGATTLVKMREIDVVTNVFFVFDPTNITIGVGDTVMWTNTVSDRHDTTHNPANGQARFWASPELSSAASPNTFSFVFSDPGVYSYYCSRHAFTHSEETGTVTVIAPNVAPMVSITSPTNGASFFSPASFTIQATASDTDGIVTQVQVFRGTTSLGVTTNSSYSNDVSALATGTYAFIAVAIDNQGAKATSSVVTVNVVAPPVIRNSVEVLPDGNFHLRIFGGNSGETCVIDACAALPNWTPIFTNVFPNTDCAFCPFVDFTESETNLNRRFYRSRVFP